MAEATTTFEELTDTPEELRLYLQERAIEAVTAMICRLMEKKGVSRSQMADRLGKVPGWITQVLDGEKNKTIRTLSDLLWVLDETLEFSTRPVASLGAQHNHRNGKGSYNYNDTVPWGSDPLALSTSSQTTRATRQA